MSRLPEVEPIPDEVKTPAPILQAQASAYVPEGDEIVFHNLVASNLRVVIIPAKSVLHSRLDSDGIRSYHPQVAASFKNYEFRCRKDDEIVPLLRKHMEFGKKIFEGPIVQRPTKDAPREVSLRHGPAGIAGRP